MKYLEDSRFTQLTSDLTEAFLNTRGSGNGSSGSANMGGNGRRNRNSNRGGSKAKKQQHHQQPSSGGQSTPAKGGGKGRTGSAASNSPYLPSSTFHYNPAGYSSYDGGTSSSSCRVIYGRIEAYTTKRAGSDKKTAHEVGERYAHEMERLNEAVEELKKRHMLEKEKDREEEMDAVGGGYGEQQHLKRTNNEVEGDTVEEGGHMAMDDIKASKEKQRQAKRRGRSCSLDGVTFAGPSTSRIITSEYTPIATIPEVRTKEVATESSTGISEEEGHAAKRNLPLEGILKQPSSNKRWRATSFDISTGPSNFSSRYTRPSSSPTLLGGTSLSGLVPWGASTEEDANTHPLIPQPSLYQSSLGDSTVKGSASLPTMVPRRLVTDLILTLNASFPDYDFGDARPSDFCTLSVPEAMRRINEKLGEFAATTDKGRNFLPRFWGALDDVVFGLKDAEVYSYAPRGDGGDDDPLGFLTTTLVGSNDNWAGNDDHSANDGHMLFQSGDLAGLDTANLPHRILPSPAASSENAVVTLWSTNYFFVSRNKKRIVLFACVQAMRSPQGDDYEEEGDEYDYGENDLVFDEARRGSKKERMEEDFLSYPNANSNLSTEDSNMVEDPEEGVDVDVDEDVDEGDEDQEENDFDTGALNRSIRPPEAPDRMAMA